MKERLVILETREGFVKTVPMSNICGHWVTNTAKDFDQHYGFDSRAAYAAWRAKFVEGPPKATEKYTVERLAKMGMIGLYTKEGK